MYYISSDKTKLEIESVMGLLKQTYWANQRSFDTVKTSVENSLCYGVYLDETNELVGFARVITDFATTYYLCDVIIDRKYRGQGIGYQLMNNVVHDKRLSKLCGILSTRDAQKLYEKFGFSLGNGRFMRCSPRE